MNVFIAAIVATLSVGCVSSARLDTLERQNAELAQQNYRLRQERVQPGQAPDADKAPPTTRVAQTTKGSTGAMWTRQPHGVYMGTVGATARQVTQGRKIKLDNQVCDGGSRSTWSNCVDSDDSGSPDLNTWLAFEIDGQPVVCDAGYFHPESQVSLLPPGQACNVELGRSRTVKLTIKAYRNSGTTSYVMLDSTPYATTYRTVSVGNRNILNYAVDETLL